MRKELTQNLEESSLYKKKWKSEVRHHGDRNSMGQGAREKVDEGHSWGPNG